MKLVEFSFGTYEELVIFQYIVESEEDVSKIYADFQNSVKQVLKKKLQKIREININNNITRLEDILDDIDKLMLEKGWKHPEIIKGLSADLLGEFIVSERRFDPFSSWGNIGKDLDKLFKETIEEVTSGK